MRYEKIEDDVRLREAGALMKERGGWLANCLFKTYKKRKKKKMYIGFYYTTLGWISALTPEVEINWILYVYNKAENNLIRMKWNEMKNLKCFQLKYNRIGNDDDDDDSSTGNNENNNVRPWCYGLKIKSGHFCPFWLCIWICIDRIFFFFLVEFFWLFLAFNTAAIANP